MTSSSLRARCCRLGVSLAGDLQLFEAVEPHMGTLVRIKLYAAGRGAGASRIPRRIRPHRAARRHALRLPAGQRTESHLPGQRSATRCRSSDDLFEVVAAAQQLARRNRWRVRRHFRPAHPSVARSAQAATRAGRRAPSKPLACAAAIASCISMLPAAPSSSIRRTCSSTWAASPRATRPTRR